MALGSYFKPDFAVSVPFIVLGVAGADQVNQLALHYLNHILKDDADLLDKMKTAWTTKAFGDVLNHREYSSRSTKSLHSYFPSGKASKETKGEIRGR